MRVADGEGALADEGERDPRLPAALERERRADGHRDEVAEHGDEREHPARRTPEVHVPVATPRRPVAATEEVPEHLGDRDAACEVRRELAVERA